MKIICVGYNYALHNRELNGEMPDEPVFFVKPDTALLRNNEPFFIPSFSHDLQYETEVVVKIDRVVKAIDEKFASRCYHEAAVGIDFTARDLQRTCREKGLPWEICKAFDKSAPVPNVFLPKEALGDLQQLDFHLDINGRTVQRGNTADMLFSIDRIISYVSQFMTLKIGDLIFTGTPAGVGQVHIGDRLEAYLRNTKMLDFEIK